MTPKKKEVPPSGNAANSFLDAAQKQVSVNGRRAEDIAAREQSMEQHAEAYKKPQAEFFKKHLVPILDQLADLPQLNGRKFAAESRFALLPPERPRLTVNIHYHGKPPPMLKTYDSLMIIMDDFIDELRFSARVVRMDKMQPGSKFDHLTIPVIADIQQLKAEIGKFVADVAPDRVAELAAGPSTSKKPAPGKGSPKP